MTYNNNLEDQFNVNNKLGANSTKVKPAALELPKEQAYFSVLVSYDYFNELIINF